MKKKRAAALVRSKNASSHQQLHVLNLAIAEGVVF